MNQETEPPPREPLLNAPWPSVVLLAALVAAYGWQAAQSTLYVDTYALSAQAVGAGRWEVLVTHLFLHGGLGHLLMNCGAAIAFGPPVSRLLGTSGRGGLLFFVFFLVCGVLSAFGFPALHADGRAAAIGASGAVSAMWGGASRMLRRRGELDPILTKSVLQQAAVFMAINGVVGLLGGFGGYSIAWEAHVAGYIAGLLLVGPLARLAGR